MRTRTIAMVFTTLALIVGPACYVLGYRHGADELGSILGRDRLLVAVDRVEYNMRALNSSDPSAARARIASDLYATLVSIGTSSAARHHECTPATRVALGDAAAYIASTPLPPVYAGNQAITRALMLCTKPRGSVELRTD